MKGILSFSVAILFTSITWANQPVIFQDAYEDGFVLSLWHENYSQAELVKMLKRIKQTGAKHLTISYFGCQPDKYSTEVDTCITFHTRPFMLQLAKLAISQGFNTSFLPIVGASDGSWRGHFQPRNLDRWFETYTKWITQVAADARDLGMKEVIVGSELNSLSRHEAKWREVFKKVRAVYRGPLVMTVNWDDVTGHNFWDGVDAIGVSGYFPLASRTGASQSELNNGWASPKRLLLDLSKQWRRPLHMTEVGYSNTPVTATKAWSIKPTDPIDLFIQAMCYESFAWNWENERDLVRTNFWSTSGADADTKSINMEPLGTSAEKITERFFKNRSRLR